MTAEQHFPGASSGKRCQHHLGAPFVTPATIVGIQPLMTGLTRLAKEAASCQRCDLYRNATQTVFGDGTRKASLMLVGEQPGDQEDKAGKPFVGPAGRLLDKALAAADIDRGALI